MGPGSHLRATLLVWNAAWLLAFAALAMPPGDYEGSRAEHSGSPERYRYRCPKCGRTFESQYEQPRPPWCRSAAHQVHIRTERI